MFSRLWVPLLFVCSCVVSQGQSVPQKLVLLDKEWASSGLRHTFVSISSSKIYAFLQMDGTFARTGWHIPKEMGGVWAHPFKVLNGFSFNLFEDRKQWKLTDPIVFVHAFVWGRWEYELPGLHMIREDRPLDTSALLVSLIIENQDVKPKEVGVQWELDVNIRPTWRAGFPDAQDILQFKGGLLLAYEKGRKIGIAAGADISPVRTKLDERVATRIQR